MAADSPGQRPPGSHPPVRDARLPRKPRSAARTEAPVRDAGARLFALWHRFRAGEFGREELLRRLIPLQARLGRLLRRGQDTPDHKAAGLCRELRKWWPALWTFARVEGVEP